MLKLISIELKKIFKKKSIYIMMIIMFLFNLLNNILFYTDYDNNGNYKYLDEGILEKELDILNNKLSTYNGNENSSLYVELNTKIDSINIKKKYKKGSWQYNKTEDYLYSVLENINIYTYQINDVNKLNEYKQELNILLDKFNNDNWEYFINIDISNIEYELSMLEENLLVTNNEKDRLEINKVIEEKNKLLKELKYRLDNKIKYDDSYLNNALNTYINKTNEIEYYNNLDKMSLKERTLYQDIKIELEINKYILDNKQNYNKQNNLNNQLRTIVDDYEIFIIILILIVASTIMSEEINTGTIKLLLIKPYSRGKILLSKYLSIIIFMLFIIMYLILLQILIGGYIFGFSSLDIPVIVYNFNKLEIVEYNIFVYMIIRIITKLPLLIMISTISFGLGTIINNIALSITVPLFIYIFTPTINYLILNNKINIFKYLVNINWEFNNYLFGKNIEIEDLNFKISLIIWITYYIIIMIFTYINFKRKNIRNV